MGPDEYVLQRARHWRETEKRLIASPEGEDKTKARTAHQEAKKKLREAVDIADRKQGK